MIVSSALGSIHTCDLLDVNDSLDGGLYCTKWVHSHLLFGQLLPGLKFNNGLCTHFSRLCGLKSTRNSSRLINRRCEQTLKHCSNVTFTFASMVTQILMQRTVPDTISAFAFTSIYAMFKTLVQTLTLMKTQTLRVKVP